MGSGWLNVHLRLPDHEPVALRVRPEPLGPALAAHVVEVARTRPRGRGKVRVSIDSESLSPEVLAATRNSGGIGDYVRLVLAPLRGAGSGRERRRTVQLGLDHEVVWEGVQAGSYRVILSVGGNSGGVQYESSECVVIDGEERSVRVKVDAVACLRVNVRGASGRAYYGPATFKILWGQVRLRDGELGTFGRTVQFKGPPYCIVGVPPGGGLLQVSVDGFAVEEVKFPPSDGEVSQVSVELNEGRK